MSGGRIAAAPRDLNAEARHLRDAAGELDSLARTLRSPPPPMPAGVRAHVEGELGWSILALSQLSGSFVDEAGGVANRSALFALAGEGGLSAALGGYLSAFERYGDPWLDGLRRLLITPRYARFGTWVRAYSYINKYGTLVKVGRHWRNLPTKLMQERPVFAGIGEDSAIVKGLKVAGRGGIALSFAAGALDEYLADKDKSETGRLESAATTGAATAVGALSGAETGAAIGATVGSLFPGPGTVVGGAVGGVAGLVGGSIVGEKIGHAISGLFS